MHRQSPPCILILLLRLNPEVGRDAHLPLHIPKEASLGMHEWRQHRVDPRPETQKSQNQVPRGRPTA